MDCRYRARHAESAPTGDPRVSGLVPAGVSLVPPGLARAGGFVVADPRLSDVTGFPAGARHAPAEIDVLRVHPLRLVEPTDGVPGRPSHEDEGANRPANGAGPSWIEPAADAPVARQPRTDRDGAGRVRQRV